MVRVMVNFGGNLLGDSFSRTFLMGHRQLHRLIWLKYMFSSLERKKKALVDTDKTLPPVNIDIVKT